MSDFENRARATLEASVAHLDARVRSRLTQARHAALDELGRRAPRHLWWRTLAPAAALGVAAVVATVLWSQRAGGPPSVAALPLTPTISVTAEELDLVLGEDPLVSALRDGLTPEPTI